MYDNHRTGETSSFLCGGVLNDVTCETCTTMTPTCTIALCEAALSSWEPSGGCSGVEEEDHHALIMTIIFIFGFVMFAFLVVNLAFKIAPNAEKPYWGFRRQTRGADPGMQMQQQPGMPMQQPPMMMQGGVASAPVGGVVTVPVQAGVMAAPIVAAPVQQNKPIQARVVGRS